MEELLLNYLGDFNLLSLLIAFFVGIISSLNPCSVITLPFFIASSITLSHKLERKKRKKFIYNYSFLFFIGLIISYSILLLMFSKIGSLLTFSSSWVYILAGLLTLIITAYSMNFFGSINISKITQKLIPYKYIGAILIGFIHGLISSPCGSAPFIALLSLASQTNILSSYALVLSFAIGQAMILLISGVFIGFIQDIRGNKYISIINNLLNKLFIVLLIFIGIYFFYKGFLHVTAIFFRGISIAKL